MAPGLPAFGAAAWSDDGASCTLRIEVRAPLLVTTFGLKVQVRPTAEGQDRTMLLGASGVEPLGVTETDKVPAPLVRVTARWLMVVVNAACASVTVAGPAAAPR